MCVCLCVCVRTRVCVCVCVCARARVYAHTHTLTHHFRDLSDGILGFAEAAAEDGVDTALLHEPADGLTCHVKCGGGYIRMSQEEDTCLEPEDGLTSPKRRALDQLLACRKRKEEGTHGGQEVAPHWQAAAGRHSQKSAP